LLVLCWAASSAWATPWNANDVGDIRRTHRMDDRPETNPREGLPRRRCRQLNLIT
jgi:hypothetical protein